MMISAAGYMLADGEFKLRGLRAYGWVACNQHHLRWTGRDFMSKLQVYLIHVCAEYVPSGHF